MQVADIGGRRLHVAIEGPEGAPAVAFCNSLGTDFRLWDRLLPRLPQGLRTVRWDFAGHGLSEPPPGRCTIEGHAGDLARILDAAGTGPAVIFGVSVGGQIAQALAALRPDLVRALILADTGAKIGDAASWSQRIEAVRRLGLAGFADQILERWFPPGWRAANAAELALWRMMLSRQSLEGYVATCEALRDADLTEAAGRIEVPTLVIAGLEDGSTPPALVRGLAGLIPGAEFVEIAGAGHLPMVDAADAVAGAVGRFLARLPG